MKTKLLIIIGISITVISAIVLLLFLIPYYTVISEYPPLSEETKSYLSPKCSELALLYLQEYSGVFTAKADELVLLEWPSLPKSLDDEKLMQCVNEILYKRGFTVDVAETSQMHDTQERILPTPNWLCCDDNTVLLNFTNPNFANTTQVINPKHEPMKYYDTIPVIDDTFLSKDVAFWSDVSRKYMEEYHESYPNHDFYDDLGALMIKNEMQYQLNQLGIVNAEDDIEVLRGMSLTSLPPYIGYSTIIHSTDDHYYLLQGGTHRNQVSYYMTTQMQYPNPVQLNIPNIDHNPLPRITIQMDGHNDLKIYPRETILKEPGKVEFYNETPGKLTVYIDKDGISEFSFFKSTQISVRSNSGSTWPLTEPGSYSWHGEVPTMIDGKEYDLNTGGGILVLSNDMSDLSLEEQMETAKMILMTSNLPISGMGQRGEDNVLYIDFNHAIDKLLPESREHYLQAAQRLIPFDIEIKMEQLP